MTQGSIMPNYPHLATTELDYDSIPARVRAMVVLGVPYGDEEVARSTELAREQARSIIAEIVEQDGAEAVDPAWESSQAVAVVAYLQRLGTDIFAVEEETEQVAAAVPEEVPNAAN